MVRGFVLTMHLDPEVSRALKMSFTPMWPASLEQVSHRCGACALAAPPGRFGRRVVVQGGRHGTVYWMEFPRTQLESSEDELLLPCDKQTGP